MPLAHMKPVLHASPRQHGSPDRPHVRQAPSTHTRMPEHRGDVAQHGPSMEPQPPGASTRGTDPSLGPAGPSSGTLPSARLPSILRPVATPASSAFAQPATATAAAATAARAHALLTRVPNWPSRILITSHCVPVPGLGSTGGLGAKAGCQRHHRGPLAPPSQQATPGGRHSQVVQHSSHVVPVGQPLARQSSAPHSPADLASLPAACASHTLP